MMKLFGAGLVFIGLVFTFNCWNVEEMGLFTIQLMLGPVLLGLGLQLIK